MAAAAGTCRRNGQPLPGLSIRLADLYAPPHLAAMSPSGAASEGHEPAGGPEGPEVAPLPQNGCASDVGEPAGAAAPQAGEQAAPPLDGTDAVARPPEQEANALHRRELGVESCGPAHRYPSCTIRASLADQLSNQPRLCTGCFPPPLAAAVACIACNSYCRHILLRPPCSCVVRFKVLRGEEEKAAGELNSEERALETKFKWVALSTREGAALAAHCVAASCYKHAPWLLRTHGYVNGLKACPALVC